MALQLTRFDSVDEFEERTFPYLLDREPEHNLFIGICGQIREGRYTDPYLAAVSDGDRVVGAAWRTPPHQLGLSHLEDPGALELFANDVHRAYGGELVGVLAKKDDARRFADIWTELTGRRARVHMEQRIYAATEVTIPHEVSGEGRAATHDVRDLLVAWRRAFALEAVGEEEGAPERAVDGWLDPASSGGCLVWWDGEPVSMVGYGGPTPNGNRIAPVYTPRELRGRGYASACTAEMTRRLLDEGRRFCFLYTDLANPTSNSIYQKIGYRPVCDVDQYRFV